MGALGELKARQRSWAGGAGLDIEGDYAASVEANLLQTLMKRSREAFSEGSGSELEAPDGKRAKMRALHSSSALAVNVFDYWVERDAQSLARAIELANSIGALGQIKAIDFESKFSTGLRGGPAHLDVTLALASGHTIAIESKFSEWLKAKPAPEEPFNKKYFEDSKTLWEDRELPKCQSLASDMQLNTADRFSHLGAAQLLKHALGLATKPDYPFSLHYYYFDCPGKESAKHASEIDRFASRVDPELGFRALSYQDLFSRLRESCSAADKSYVEYLARRYFD